jgi:uncharacterized protein (DUF362 family)
MDRRKFIKSGFALSGGLVLNSPFQTFCSDVSQPQKSKIVIARDSHLQSRHAVIDTDRLQKLLDNGIQNWFKTDSALEAWKNLAKPGEIIGLKVNCLSGYAGGTHPELIAAICERLQEVGIKSSDIVIWDRLNEDLEDGGFKIAYRGQGIRCFGNDAVGFSSDFEIFGKAASLVTKTMTQYCDTVINLPVLKDHGIAGITMCLKNMFGAIHNPNKYHLNVGDPYIPDVYALPSIRNKIRFTICDAIQAQYEGGPSHMPQWAWSYNGLFLGTDPVALDYTGWQIIEEQRKKNNILSLREDNREPTYIATAADAQHRLGTNDPELMDIINI